MNSIYQDTLQKVLQRIYYQQPDNTILISLLQHVADKLRAIHKQYILLPHLSHQTIMVHYQLFGDWLKISIADNQVQNKQDVPVSLTQQAQDLSGIELPDDYWRIFKYMYFGGEEIPIEFNEIADRFRDKRRKSKNIVGISEKDIWLWDEKSAQAMVVLGKKSKRNYRNLGEQLKSIGRILLCLPKLYFQYKKILKTAYQHNIKIKDRVGIALHPDYHQQELELLAELNHIPVLIRFYCHESEQQWSDTIKLIDQLYMNNNEITIALIQDRKSVIDSERWKNFLLAILPKVHDKITFAEIGHAINRVKWGIWHAIEYKKLVEITEEFKTHYPKLQFIGPAVIDFEWYRVIDILKALPKKLKFSALSQHLYVDRRGAPENYQGKFSTLEKCAMGKAMAKMTDNVENKFIISEFNWPLQETGVYSPIGSPYAVPSWFHDRPGVNEQQYANYLIRYLTIALCSGFVEQAFLWRLSAHGYGLVDDQNGFRKRPAFFALKQFIACLGDAIFLRRLDSEEDIYLFLFNKGEAKIVLAWTSIIAGINFTLPWKCDAVFDRDGVKIKENNIVRLTGEPCYLYCCHDGRRC